MKVIKHKFRLRGKTHFVSVSIFKDKATMFVLLQQLDLYGSWVAAPKLQRSRRLTCHLLCSSVCPGAKWLSLLPSWFCVLGHNRYGFKEKKRQKKWKLHVKEFAGGVYLYLTGREGGGRVRFLSARLSLWEDGTDEMVPGLHSTESFISAFV